MDLKRIITTIPGNLNLSEAEKPILHKGLNFILIKPATNEFTTKDCEKFFRWLQLKAFFQNQNKENDGPVDDPGATSDNREHNEPTSTPETIKSLSNRSQSNLSGYPPSSQFSSWDHFIHRCQTEINCLDFSKQATVQNLSKEERDALIFLRNCTDIDVKPADKG